MSQNVKSCSIAFQLTKSANADIEAYNAYIKKHGLFADIIRGHQQGDSAELEGREDTHSDWSAAAAMTAAEIEANVAADPDEAGMVMDWENVSVELP